jgi:fumarate reductase subunit C
MNVRLYLLQRGSAALMVPLIVGHLVMIFYATSGGLTAAEILGRTRGSLGWGLFYALFVLLAAIHGAIGVRSVARDWVRWSERRLDALMWLFGSVLFVLGARAVYAVVLA